MERQSLIDQKGLDHLLPEGGNVGQIEPFDRIEESRFEMAGQNVTVDHTNREQSLSDKTAGAASHLVKKKSRVSETGKIVLATVGFFSDAYDLFVVNIVLVILTKTYGFGDAEKSVVSTAALVGAITGQLTFGVIADVIGRFTAWMLTIVLITIAAIGSALAFTSGKGAAGLAGCLGFWRFLLGLGKSKFAGVFLNS
jgi:hypothetical protein